jgi:hypothetical protein
MKPTAVLNVRPYLPGRANTALRRISGLPGSCTSNCWRLCARYVWSFSSPISASHAAVQTQCKRGIEMKFDARSRFTANSKIDSGKRDAVRPKSGVQVAHSWPVQKGPTLSLRAGRKPGACPAVSQGAQFAPCDSGQSGRGVGQSPTAVACFSDLDQESLDRLVAFFQLLDEWERKLHAEKVM